MSNTEKPDFMAQAYIAQAGIIRDAKLARANAEYDKHLKFWTSGDDPNQGRDANRADMVARAKYHAAIGVAGRMLAAAYAEFNRMMNAHGSGHAESADYEAWQKKESHKRGAEIDKANMERQ